jgi:HAD superfamily hydrolase (TIGR01509 family)
VIQHVIFDLSEVILTGVKATGIELGKLHNIQVPIVFSGLSGTRNPLMIPAIWDFFHGDLTEDQYIAKVLAMYPQFGTAIELKRHIRANFKEVPGMRQLVEKVRYAGYGLALLSVHSREWIEYCEQRYDIHALFDEVVYSYIDKVSKPQPQAFMKTLNRIGAAPHECLFIDDAKANVDAARELGISSIQFTDASALNEELIRTLPRYF